MSSSPTPLKPPCASKGRRRNPTSSAIRRDNAWRSVVHNAGKASLSETLRRLFDIGVYEVTIHQEVGRVRVSAGLLVAEGSGLNAAVENMIKKVCTQEMLRQEANL